MSYGCLVSCDKKCTCSWHENEKLKNDNKEELSVRSKVNQMAKPFPDPEVIQFNFACQCFFRFGHYCRPTPPKRGMNNY